MITATLTVRWMPLFGVDLSRSGPFPGKLSPATAQRLKHLTGRRRSVFLPVLLTCEPDIQLRRVAAAREFDAMRSLIRRP